MCAAAASGRIRLAAAWPAAAAAAVLFAAAAVGFWLRVPGTEVVLVWPPSGLALALVLILGPRTWPGLAAGVLACLVPYFLERLPAPAAVATAAGESFASTAAALLGARWIRSALRGADPLGRVPDLMRALFWGGAVAQALGSALGVGIGWASGAIPAAAVPATWLLWWSASVVSVLVLTPLCLAWRGGRRPARPLRHLAVYGAAIALGLILGWVESSLETQLRVPAVLLVIAAAFVVGLRGATLAILLLAACALYPLASGTSPLAQGGVARELLLLDFYLATLALTGTTLSVLLDERRRDAERTVEREGLLRAVVDGSPLAISWADATGRVEYWNRRAEELFGYTLADIPTIYEWTARAFPDPAYQAQQVTMWDRALEEMRRTGKTTRLGESRIRCKDGTDRVVDGYGAVVRGRMLVIFADLSERLRAEAQREELRAQLAQSQRLDSIGRLAGGIAHDLNNLLMPILGYADLLLEDAVPGTPAAQDLAELRRAAERAQALTRQLLAFGRRQVLDMRTVDLRATVARIEPLLRRTLREDIRIEVRGAEPPGPVRADEGQLEQVVMNLAVNAQHAMPRGGVLGLELADLALGDGHPAAARGVAPGSWVMLAVSDTGAGMDPEVLARVFEPFFTTRGAGEGTGLGLSIVHGIVSQHGGHVWAESAPGRGTTFRVLLPRAPGESLPPAPALPPAPGAGATLLEPAREAVLLAEDEEVVRAVTRRMLEELGYRVVAAAGPLECLGFVETSGAAVDVLVTDVVMPGMDGRRLHERLAALRPGLPVVYISGYAADVLDQRGVHARGAVLLEKPFTAAALGVAIRRALREAGTEAR